MSSTIEFIQPLLAHQLVLAERQFPEAGLQHSALAGHPSAASVVRLLRGQEPDAWPAKAAVTDALLIEAQGGNEPMAAVLLHAYLPMLQTLGSAEPGFKKDPDVFWPALLEAFAEAVAAYPGPAAEPMPCRYLRRTTERYFLRERRRAQREVNFVALVEVEELDGTGDGVWETAPGRSHEQERFRAELVGSADEVSAILRRWVRGRLSTASLELIEATVLRGESITDYVERQWGTLSVQERARTYCRVQRQRCRALQVLRGLLQSRRSAFLAAPRPT